MITYKYNPIIDFKIFLHNKRSEKFLNSEKIYIIKWSLFKYIRFIFSYIFKKFNLPKVEVENDAVCYLVSSGTWGSYELPNKVFICPLELENLGMSLNELIMHEIKHLKYERKVKNMTHEEKEKFINNK